jgi:ABC-type transport system involved in multi-copper enzyme maturation permease subunit
MKIWGKFQTIVAASVVVVGLIAGGTIAVSAATVAVGKSCYPKGSTKTVSAKKLTCALNTKK